jgi:hypothetical protein
MRVIVAVKGQPGGSATSRVTRYVAERDRHAEREGKQPRALFSEREDRLSYRKADQALAGVWTPAKDELLHVAVSFHEEDFNALGNDENGRQQQLKEVAREAMAEMTEALGARKLIWVAGIHRNTAHPHLHVIIHRDYLDRKTGQVKRLDRLPKEFLPGREKDPKGQGQIKPGRISQGFERSLDRRIERARQATPPNEDREQKQAAPQMLERGAEDRRDRLILGRAMVAADKVEELKERLDGHRKYGELRRYEVTDERGRSRMLSVTDVRRRAEARADEVLRQSQNDKGRETVNPEDRREVRQVLVGREMARHAVIIEKIEQARSLALSRTEARLREAERLADSLIPAAAEIESKHQAVGIETPTPIISRADLSRMQERAIATGKVEKVRELETIRRALAAESNAPTRTPQEAGRLGARLLLAQSELVLAEERAVRFDETKHQWRWPVGDQDTRKYSLAEIERAIAWETDRAQFIGRRHIHWDASKREQSRQRVSELAAYRQSILDRIGEKRESLKAEVKEKAEMTAALSGIEREEREKYQAQRKEMPPPLPNRYELGLLDAHARERRAPTLHQLVSQLERDTGVTLAERMARARAREITAEIDTCSAHSRLESFDERRGKIEVIVKDDGARDLTIRRLSDVEPKSELEKLIFLFRQTEFREAAQTVDDYGRRLASEYEQANQSRMVLTNLARQAEQDFRREHPDKDVPPPQFTPGELTALEVHTTREPDPERREHYERLYAVALGQQPGTVARAERLDQARDDHSRDDLFSR